VSKRDYWLLFIACQGVGAVLPSFGNVHVNIAPILLGGLLLFPGDLIELALPANVSPSLEIISAVLINAVVWYLLRKILLLDSTASDVVERR
jgi:hypothetical protein